MISDLFKGEALLRFMHKIRYVFNMEQAIVDCISRRFLSCSLLKALCKDVMDAKDRSKLCTLKECHSPSVWRNQIIPKLRDAYLSKPVSFGVGLPSLFCSFCASLDGLDGFKYVPNSDRHLFTARPDMQIMEFTDVYSLVPDDKVPAIFWSDPAFMREWKCKLESLPQLLYLELVKKGPPPSFSEDEEDSWLHSARYYSYYENLYKGKYACFGIAHWGSNDNFGWYVSILVIKCAKIVVGRAYFLHEMLMITRI